MIRILALLLALSGCTFNVAVTEGDSSGSINSDNAPALTVPVSLFP